MKLINYKRGHNNTFDCSIHGTIKGNLADYYMIVNFLYNNKKSLWNEKLLYEDLARRIFIKDKKGVVKGFLINIRTTATEMIAERFGLKNYKAGNYQIEIV